MRMMRERGQPEQGRVQTVSGAQAGDEPDALFPAEDSERQLGSDIVDAVEDIVGLPVQYLGQVFGGEAAFPEGEIQLRIDVPEAPGSRFGLVMAYGGGHSDELPVEVGDVHLVIVREEHGSYAAAADGFRRGTADPSQSQDRHPAVPEGVYRFVPEQQPGACEPVVHIDAPFPAAVPAF